MFKIESYVTPLILSYVDKFIKNIKPEDSQVSNLLFSLTFLFFEDLYAAVPSILQLF